MARWDLFVWLSVIIVSLLAAFVLHVYVASTTTPEEPEASMQELYDEVIKLREAVEALAIEIHEYEWEPHIEVVIDFIDVIHQSEKVGGD